MGKLEPTPSPHTTRRIADPAADYPTPPRTDGGIVATELAYCHNRAVKTYGSDCGGFHAFDPVQRLTLGVYDGHGGFPDGSVVTPLKWGRITSVLAQRVLEGDGVA